MHSKLKLSIIFTLLILFTFEKVLVKEIKIKKSAR